MNSFDKLLIEYRRKLFYQKELYKSNLKLRKIIEQEEKKINKFKKRPKKYKYKFLFHKDNIKINNSDEEKGEKNLKFPKKIGKNNFVNLDSWRDIERKKIELLYKIKHDIKYKISKGKIYSNEMDNFNNFQNKINNLIKEYQDFNIDLYVKQLEEFFSSFEDEISNKEKKKYNEDRINNFLRRLKDEFNDKIMKRQISEQKICKVIDYNKINNINTLYEAKIKEEK